ncbi:hypothetical protein M3Y97_00535600 [Aphelenchoides bicaudatus]|nr:hypothetical protein M3Y97_00535600 [Aphelenchoides bicaudatus]
MLGRLTRINQVMHNLLKLYPEQFLVYITFGTAGTIAAIHIALTRPLITSRPYYRGYYDVVRPDHELVHSWRVPEEYPAYYLSNRRADSWKACLERLWMESQTRLVLFIFDLLGDYVGFCK